MSILVCGNLVLTPGPGFQSNKNFLKVLQFFSVLDFLIHFYNFFLAGNKFFQTFQVNFQGYLYAKFH